MNTALNRGATGRTDHKYRTTVLGLDREPSVPFDPGLVVSLASLVAANLRATGDTPFTRVLVGLGAGAYTVATPQSDVECTEFALLTNNGSSACESGDDPTELTREQPVTLTVSVENQHREAANYSMIRALDFPPHEPAWTRVGDRKLSLTKSDYESVRSVYPWRPPVPTASGRPSVFFTVDPMTRLWDSSIVLWFSS